MRRARVAFGYRPKSLDPRYVLRLAAGGVASAPIAVRSRDVTLAAFGDANFGDGVLSVMDQRGTLHPWRGVAPALRRADIAFGNLECAISNRGAPVPKEYNFRGRPRDLAAVVRFAGLDVLNLANNHAGDFGMPALLDTVRAVRAAGAVPVGAGATLAAAQRPQVVTPAGPARRVRRLLGHRAGVVLRRAPARRGRRARRSRRSTPASARARRARRRRRRDLPLGRRARRRARTPASARSPRRR